MSDQHQHQQSGQSSKIITQKKDPNSPSPHEHHKPLLPPIKHLPLRKRLAIGASIKTPKVVVSPKEPIETAAIEEEYPPTPGSQHSSPSSSGGNSSDSTIPIIHSPPSQQQQKIEQQPKEEEEVNNKPVIKQPLKKAYHWTKGKKAAAAAVNTIVKSNNNNKLAFNNGGLPGNPLLWNNGDAEKYVKLIEAPWTSAEDTIDSFKSAWLGESDEDDDGEEEEQAIQHKTIAIRKSNSISKRGRPSISTKKSNNDVEEVLPPALPPPLKVRKNSGRSTMDGKLYCVCRQPYDATRFMIACDRCDDWFHGECIGINEKESEFVDLYFCTKCSKSTGKKSSWKPKCANPACHKAARIGSQLGHLSKYCSDSCGMQVARARLELVEIKRRNNSSQQHNSRIPIAQLALMKQRQLRTTYSFADKQDKQRLIQTRLEKRKIRDNVLVIDRKLGLLNELKLIHPMRDSQGEEETEEDSLVDEPCGFDYRLIESDTYWKEYDSIQHPSNFPTCQTHKCLKHVQWQKIISLDFEQERKEQFTHLAILERERKQIKDRMRTRRSEKVMMKDLINGTIRV